MHNNKSVHEYASSIEMESRFKSRRIAMINKEITVFGNESIFREINAVYQIDNKVKNTIMKCPWRDNRKRMIIKYSIHENEVWEGR